MNPTPTPDRLSAVLNRLDERGNVTDPELAAMLGAVDWHAGVDPGAVFTLREVLSDLERRTGVGQAHRVASVGLLSAVPGWRLTGDRGHRGQLQAFGFDPTRRYLAVASHCGADYDRGGALQVWEVASGRCVNTHTGIRGGTSFRDRGTPGLLRWHPGGQRVGLAFDTSSVGVFDPFGGDAAPTLALDPADGSAHASAFCWSPDGRVLAVAGWAERQLTDLCSEVPILLYDVHVDPVDPTRDTVGRARVLDPDHAAPWDDDSDPDGGYRPSFLGWSSDGQRLTGFADTAQVFQPGTQTAFPVDLSVLPDLPTSYVDDGAGAAFSPDGRSLALIPGDNLVVLDVTAERSEIRCGHAYPDGTAPFGTVWSDDGRQIAVLTEVGVLVVAVGSNELVHQLPWVPTRQARDWTFGDGRAVAFDSTGRRLVVLGDTEDGRVAQVWQVDGPAELLCATPVDDRVRGVGFADADRTLVGYGPAVLEFRDAATGHLRHRHLLASGPDVPGDAGHPLAYPGGQATAHLPHDPAFPVLTGAGADDPGAWHWLTAFDTGLVVCPPGARQALATSLSFVVDRRFAWPAHWALGTPALEVHDDWGSALTSPRLPAGLPGQWRQWRAADGRRPGPERARGLRRTAVDQLLSEPPTGAAASVEVPTREAGYYRAERVYGAGEVTGALLRSLLGSAVLARRSDADRPELVAVLAVDGPDAGPLTVHLLGASPDGGRVFSIALDARGIQEIATVHYLGHPDDHRPVEQVVGS